MCVCECVCVGGGLLSLISGRLVIFSHGLIFLFSLLRSSGKAPSLYREKQGLVILSFPLERQDTEGGHPGKGRGWRVASLTSACAACEFSDPFSGYYDVGVWTQIGLRNQSLHLVLRFTRVWCQSSGLGRLGCQSSKQRLDLG